MRSFANPAVSLERQLTVIAREIKAHRAELERLSGAKSVSAEHAVRQTELAQRIRLNLDWLEPLQARMRADLVRLLAEEAA